MPYKGYVQAGIMYTHPRLHFEKNTIFLLLTIEAVILSYSDCQESIF